VFGNVSAGSVDYFVTTARDANYNWEVSAQGSSQTGITTDVVRDIVSYAQGVNPKRNINLAEAYTPPAARRLQTNHAYVWSGTLIADIAAESPTTQTLSTLGSDDSTFVSSEMSTVLGANFVVSPYTNSAYAPAQQTVSWSSSPALGDKTHDSVTINFTSDNANGQVACAVYNTRSQSEYETNNEYKPSAEQVFLGLDSDNDSAVVYDVLSADLTSMTLPNLSKGTKYSAFCTASNGYLVWPSFVTYSNQDSYAPINFTTDGTADVDDEDDDSALLLSSNVVAICTMLLALIFN